MKKIKSLLLGALFIIVSTTLQAQSFEATGVVVDNFGDAVIGATVMQKGTSNGTVTDIDGNFKINVNNGDILSVSYIGYVTQEFPAAKDMRIVLKEDAQSLQEVRRVQAHEVGCLVSHWQEEKADYKGSPDAWQSGRTLLKSSKWFHTQLGSAPSVLHSVSLPCLFAASRS